MLKGLRSRRWMLSVGVAASILGGVSYAMPRECWFCGPCGSANDGGYLMCCDAVPCP